MGVAAGVADLAGGVIVMMVRAAAPPGQAGAAFGIVSTGFNIGGMIGPPAYGWLVDTGRPGTVFAVAAALMAATAIMGLFQDGRRQR